MITDEELRRLIDEAANEIVVPSDGASAIVTAAVGDAVPSVAPAAERRQRPQRLRRPLLAGASIAAVAAIAVGVVVATRPSTPPPVTAARTPVFGNAQAATHAGSIAAPSAKAAPVAPLRSGATSSASQGRDIVTTGTLRITVSRHVLVARLARLEALVGALGGYVSSSNIREQGTDLGGTVVIEVPAARFASLSSRASALGTVHALITHETDVSDEVVNTAAQLTALEGELTRLETLAQRTASVSSLLAVENDITSVEAQIDSTESSQRALARQVRDATLTVDVAVASGTIRHHTGASGFGHAWHEAVAGFLAAVRGLVASLGVVLFLLLALAGLGLLVRFPGRWAWRASRRRLL